MRVAISRSCLPRSGPGTRRHVVNARAAASTARSISASSASATSVISASSYGSRTEKRSLVATHEPSTNASRAIDMTKSYRASGVERMRQRARLDEVVLDRAVGPAAVAADRMDALVVEQLAQPRGLEKRSLRDVHVRRIERHVVLRDQLVVGDDTFLREVGEHAVAQSRHIDGRAIGRTDLDVEAHAIAP